MSRIGKKPIEIPSGVTVDLKGRDVTVKGPKGELSLTLLDDVTIKQEDNALVIEPTGKSKRSRSMWGMQRTLVANLVHGVTEGFERKLQISGVGFRAQVKGKTLNMQLGYSHDIDFPIPDGIDINCPDQTTIVVSGIDKQQVGHVASKIRNYRTPEPYKGKGVKYEGEYIFRKEGKKK